MLCFASRSSSMGSGITRSAAKIASYAESSHPQQEQAEQFVDPFLELVKQMYANTKSVVEKEFNTPKSAVSESLDAIRY